jgi:hypothetical protein
LERKHGCNTVARQPLAELTSAAQASPFLRFYQQYAMAQTPIFMSHLAMDQTLAAEP